MKFLATSTLSCFTLLLTLCLSAGSLVAVEQAQAQVTVTGDTGPASAFNRPDCSGAIPGSCALDARATATRFEGNILFIGSSGTYTISSTQNNWDGVLLLYDRNAEFDPNTPLDNILGFNDDDPAVGSSKITMSLNNSGANIAALYGIVTTGFDNNEFGTYTTSISGPAGGLVLASDGTNLSNNLAANTSGGPVWNRPECPTANADPTSLASCSVSTLSPRFAVHNFTPTCNGTFFFGSDQDYDGFLMLYEGNLDITNPLQNLVAYNDDWPAQGNNRASAFLVNLKANTKYFLVNTGFNNTAAGNFEQAIFGPQGCAVATATEDAGEVPHGYELSEMYPNPFNRQAQFTLAIGQTERVVINVFDVLGRRVATLHDGPLAAGTKHMFSFEAAKLPSGLYMIRTQGETFADTRNAYLIK